jgi:hypothetical protein
LRTRNSFVSNSSSCSFILATNAKNEKQFEKAFKISETNAKDLFEDGYLRDYFGDKAMGIETLTAHLGLVKASILSMILLVAGGYQGLSMQTDGWFQNLKG